MKHQNSISRTYIYRDEVILPQLFELAKSCATFPTTMLSLCSLVANIPVSSFYISEDSALNYVRRRQFKGVRTRFVNKYKERLYEALYAEVCSMMQSDKYKNRGLSTVTILALSHPAPCIGMTPQVIQQKLYRHIKKCRQTHATLNKITPQC